MPICITSESAAPITENVRKNTSAIMPKKQGIAVYFPVSRRSIAILRLCSLLSCGRTTVSRHSFSRKVKRILASAASLSMPVSCCIMETRWSKASCFSSGMVIFFFICSSSSTSFVVANLTGSPAALISGSSSVAAECIQR